MNEDNLGPDQSQTPNYFHRRWNSGGSEEDVKYQSVCPWSVIALVVGFFSITAFLYPVLWVIPVFTVGFSLLSFYSISKRPDELLGRRISLIAMCFAILCGVAAATQWYSYRYLLQNEGQQFVQTWFDLVSEGRMIEAYELQAHPLNRRISEKGLENQYMPGSKNRENLEGFLKNETVKLLSDPAMKASARFVRVKKFTAAPFREYVVYEYEIQWDQMDGRKSMLAEVTVARAEMDLDQGAIKISGWLWNGINKVEPNT